MASRRPFVESSGSHGAIADCELQHMLHVVKTADLNFDRLPHGQICRLVLLLFGAKQITHCLDIDLKAAKSNFEVAIFPFEFLLFCQ